MRPASLSSTVLPSQSPQVPSVAWEDIGGYEDVKQALREMIEVRIMQPKHAVAVLPHAPCRAVFS